MPYFLQVAWFTLRDNLREVLIVSIFSKSVGSRYLIVINLFYATDLFWYPLKASENQRFSDVFKKYQKRSVAWNGLKCSVLVKKVADYRHQINTNHSLTLQKNTEEIFFQGYGMYL